jgi:hypothetical protein
MDNITIMNCQDKSPNKRALLKQKILSMQYFDTGDREKVIT